MSPHPPGLRQCWNQHPGLLCWFHEPGHKTGPEGGDGVWGTWLSLSVAPEAGGSWSAPCLGPLGAWVCLGGSHSSRALKARPHGTEKGAPWTVTCQSGLWEHSPADLTSEWTPSPTGGRRPLFLLPRSLEHHREPGRAQGTDSDWPKPMPQSALIFSPQTRISF